MNEEVELNKLLNMSAKDYMVAKSLNEEVIKNRPEEIDELNEYLDNGATIGDAIELIYVLRLINELEDINKNREYTWTIKEMTRSHEGLCRLRKELSNQLQEERMFNNYSKGRTA